ncbi:MAG: hypothetical protein ACXVBR_02390 [Flavisolibacter sp.]
MIPEIRKEYNARFTSQKYESYLQDLNKLYPGQLDFRVAETPIFIPKDFTANMFSACEHVIDVISTPEYGRASERAIPPSLRVPHEDTHPQCIAFDFGICQNEKGTLEPQLIEMQGFPSLFAWQAFQPEVHHRHFWWPEGFSPYLNGFTKESYVQMLKNIIVTDIDPEHVVLLEILPHQQKTRVDFYATGSLLDIDVVCLTDLVVEGKDLFYFKDGKKTAIQQIYNRVIFDDLLRQAPAIQEKGKIFQQELNVNWVPHPNWFYRLSKFTLPFLKHRFVPETRFLNELEQLPKDLENYVVKPLFSFAGQGVIIDVTAAELEKIRDPENWIIQKKVLYADAIQTPGENAKAEIRLFYFWEPGAERPLAANNLCRLSKGKMVGVRYNKDKEWVGGSFCLFEK